MKKPNETRMTVRFPTDVLNGIRELAPLHDRSLNSEIVRAVRVYIAQQKGKTHDAEKL